MIDWDGLVVGPLIEIFGEPVTYIPASGAPLSINGIFDEAYTPVQFAGGSDVISAKPMLGIQLSEFPVGYDPEAAQGDRFRIERTGVTYSVKAGKPDSHGGARLEGNIV